MLSKKIGLFLIRLNYFYWHFSVLSHHYIYRAVSAILDRLCFSFTELVSIAFYAKDHEGAYDALKFCIVSSLFGNRNTQLDKRCGALCVMEIYYSGPVDLPNENINSS